MANPPPSRRPLAAIEALEPRTLLAASLVADLNTDPASPFNFSSSTRVGDTLYVTLHSTVGHELWKSDGTPKGTRLVRDIEAGVPSSYPDDLIPLDDHTLLFSATTATGGHALWRTNGTRKSTVPIKSIPNGHVQGAIAAHGRVFFSVDRISTASRRARDSLWVTDGTTKGTRRILQQDNLNIRRDFLLYKRYVLFTADLTNSQQMLFMTDGTRAGTTPLPHVPIDNLSIGHEMHALGNHLIYSEPTYHGQGDLWKTNLKWVRPIKDFGTFGSARSMTVIGDKLYFSANDDVHGEEPWVTDGTRRGTYLLKDLVTARNRRNSYPHSFRARDGDVYFRADDDGGQRSLYKTDGTPEGTVRVGPAATPGVRYADPLFSADDANGIGQIWHASTPGAEPRQVTHFPGPAGVHASLTMLDDRRLLFIANDGKRTAIWITDGTPDGTRPLRRIPHLTRSADPSGLGTGHDAFYFGIDHPDVRNPDLGPPPLGAGSLWKIPNGKQPEQIALLDGSVDRIIPADDFTYFTVRQTYTDWGIAAPFSHYFLWKTDGTAIGTHKVFDLSLFGSLHPDPPPLVMLNRELFYARGSLWKTDGTHNGSQRVIEASADELILIGQNLFVIDREVDRIWITDGTTEGARILVDYSDNHDRFLTSVLRAGDRVYYFVSGYDDHKPDELWTTDGTPDGTRLVKRFHLPDSVSRYNIYDGGHLLLFNASDPEHGEELWRSDGTPKGTRKLKDINKGPEGASPDVIANIGDHTYFTAYDAVHGRELWVTDGTPKGTRLLSDLRFGPEHPFIQYATTIDGNILFAADDGIHGLEPWIIRPGQSPELLADIFPGRASSEPRDFAAHDGLLYFSANDDLHGRELWSTPL